MRLCFRDNNDKVFEKMILWQYSSEVKILVLIRCRLHLKFFTRPLCIFSDCVNVFAYMGPIHSFRTFFIHPYKKGSRLAVPNQKGFFRSEDFKISEKDFPLYICCPSPTNDLVCMSEVVWQTSTQQLNKIRKKVYVSNVFFTKELKSKTG